MSDDDRNELARRIVGITKAALGRYSEEFPQRVGDGRNKDALDWSFRGVARIIALLDDYEISRKQPREKSQEKKKPK